MTPHTAYAQGRVKGLKEESWGLVVEVENGPTKLEFTISDPVAKKEIGIGKVVRATLEITDA